MNEQALNDAFNLFTQAGYNGDINKFVNLISTNPKALDDAHQLFTQAGYNGDINKFKVLIGVGQSQAEPEQPKKKDGGIFSQPSEIIRQAEELASQQGSVSSSDQSSSVSPSVDQTQQPTYGYSWGGDEQAVPTAQIQNTESSAVTETLAFENKADINKRMLDKEKSLKEEAAQNLLNWRETQARKIQEEEKNKEEEARLNAEAIGISKTPEFINKLNKIDNTLFYDNELIDNLNDEFSQYGITMTKGGVFNNKLIARTEDGRKTIDIDLTPSSEADMVSESEKLRKFISENNRVTKEEDFLSAALRAKNMRSSARINEDGTTSTVKFVSFDNKVIPTLFPILPGLRSTSKDAWIELPFEQALKVAQERGEVFTFKTEKEAQDFANGSWKNISKVDIEGDEFYKKRGRDYITDKRRWERYDELDDMINFFEGYDNENKERIMSERPEMFVNGMPRYDIKQIVGEMKKEREELRPLVKDIGFFTQEGTSEWTRMDFDAHLAKKENETAKEATKIFRNAQTDLSMVNTESLKNFGVTIDQLVKKNKSQVSDPAAYDSLIQKYMETKQLAETAGMKYAEAKTYFDAKINKDINNDFVDNFEATLNAWNDGLNNGLIGDQLLAMTLPGYDSYSGVKDKEGAAKYISEKLANMSNTQSRAMTRLSQAKTTRDWWDVFSDDPLEISILTAAQSISLMLPIGSKILPVTVGVGASIGAGYGALSTAPTGGVGVLPGFIGGASTGFRTGQAMVGYATEYTTAIMDAVKNNGYDPLDPKSLEKALGDPKVWSEGRDVGMARGIPIAVVDGLTAGMAGRIFKPASKLASVTEKVAKGTVENVAIDPLAEASGELIAQGSEITFGTGRKGLDWNEIALEGVGSMGSNLPNYALNTYLDTKSNTDINLAYNLTNVKNIAAERVSDERISNWANNMEKLGKIDASVNQRIQENIGLRRDAKEILSVGSKGAGSNTDVTSRTMELLAAKKELTATNNRQEVYSAEIKAINEELSIIGKTKKIPAKEEQVNITEILNIPEAQRESVGEYMIDGIRYTKEQFLDKINKFTPKRLLRSKVAVKGDPEVSQAFKEKYNAFQEQTTGEVSVQPEARVGEEMVQGESQAGPQVTTQKGVLSTEETKRKEDLTSALNNAPEGSETVTIGDMTIDRAEAQTELNSIFEKEKTAPKPQLTKQATVEVFTSVPTETKAEISFTTPEGNEVALEGNEQVASQMYDDAVSVPKEQRTKEQNDIVEKFQPIVAENEANLLESLLAEENVPEAAPTEAAPAEARVEFTEQDRARKTELEDAMKNSDKRRKNIMVGETSVPKAEVKAELDALNKKEQDYTKQETGQFQLEISENRSKAQQELIDEATSLMEKEEENGFSEKVFDGTQPEPTVEIIPIEIKENTELAKKVKRMGLSQLIGKKINLVMADQLKVGNLSIGGKILNRMGGPFFPLIDKLFGKVAWASMDLNAASTIVNGAIKSDYTVVYNMNPSAIDSNNAIRETFIATIESLPIQEQDVLFKQIVDHLKDKKFGDKTTQVRDIVSKSETLKGFFDDISKLDVDTKAAIINLIVPSRNVVSETAIGKALQEKDITIENLREQNIEQFVANLPAGALTVVLEIQDKSGNKVTEKTKAEAILTREQQEKEGLPTHDNYPIYLRGKAIAILSETVPFWNIFKDSLENINAKVAKILTKKTGKEYTAKEARSNEMRSASMTANVAREVSSPSVTEYEKFISLLSRAFPSIEIVTSQKEFDKLANDLNAQKLSTKDQNIYGAVYKGKLYLNPSLENYNTPIHEFGHIWTNIVKDSNPKLYNKGIELISKSPYVQQILNSKEYQRVIKEMRNNGISEAEINEYVLEEALATAIGDKGESFVIASQAKNFEKWLDRLYSFVRKLTGISKYTEQQLQDITLNEFLQAVSVDILSGNVLFEQSKIKEFSDKLQLSTGGFDFNKAVEIAKKNGISDEGIRIFLKRKGLDEAKINQLLGTEPTARATKMNESTFPGYDAIMDKVDAMIARQIKRGIEGSKIANNLDALLRKFDEYVNATDAQKKALEQEARNRIGAEQKKAPSFGRILGAFKDLTTLTTKDKKKIVSNIMQLAKDAAKDLADDIRAMKVNGKITTSQFTAIQKRLSKVNFTNEVSINSFVDYMTNVFNDVEYANKMAEVRKLQTQVKKRNHTSMSQAVKEFASISPELIPYDKLLKYIQALDDLNTRAPFYEKMNDMFVDITSYKPEAKEFDAIKTFQALINKLEDIAINKVKSVEDYVKLIRDINSFKRKTYQLFQNGDITQEQYDQVIENIGKDQDAVEKKYEKELSVLKESLIQDIKKLKPEIHPDFTPEEKALIEKYLELSDADLASLSPENLYVLSDLLSNIKEDVQLDYYRLSDIVSKAYTTNEAKKVSEQLKNAKFNKSTEQGRKKLSEFESSFWEGVLGLGRATSGAMQKFIVSPFMRGIASFEEFMQKGYNSFLKLKEKYKMKEYNMHRLGVLTTYLQEYMAQFDPENSNEPNIGKRDWFDEILNDKQMRNSYPDSKPSFLKTIGAKKSEIQIIEKIWDSLPKGKDGKVDPKAVYDSYMANDGKYFTEKEKAFFDAVMDYKNKNITTKQKAANELRGNPFKEIAFHTMRVRYDSKNKQISPTPSGEGGLVRIEAGTGKERASQKVGPIMTNFEQLFVSNIEQTGRDYYLTSAIKDINNVLSIAKKDLGKDGAPIIETISNTLSDALAFEFDKSSSQFILRSLMSAKVAETLLDVERTARELISSLASYPLRAKTLAGYKDLFSKVKSMGPLLEFTESPLRLRNNISSAIEMNDGEIKKMRFMEKTLVYLAGLPERTMMVTSWMPTFREDFKNTTGVAFDPVAFKNNPEYKQKYGKAIKEAAAAADAQTEKIIGTTTKAGQRREIRIAPSFLAGLIGKQGTVSKNTVAGQILGFFSNYPYREVTEFMNGFREAAEVYKTKGVAGSSRQLTKSLGVVANVALYGFLSSLSYAMWSMLLGDDEEEEKAEKELERLLTAQGFGEDLAGNFLSLAASKYSAGGKAMLQLGATMAILGPTTDEQKASIAKILKSSVYLNPLPTDKTNFASKTEMLAAPAKYVPQFVILADRWLDGVGTYEEINYIYNKVKDKGIGALTEDEGAKILAINVAINSVQTVLNFRGTSIPMYNKIKMGMRTLKKEAGVDKIVGGEVKEGKGYGENNKYKTQEEYKIADPVGYYKSTTKGGEIYQKREEDKIKDKASEETKKAEYIDKYGAEAYYRANPVKTEVDRKPRSFKQKSTKKDDIRKPRF